MNQRDILLIRLAIFNSPNHFFSQHIINNFYYFIQFVLAIVELI